MPAEIDFGVPPDDRPFVIANMVAALDGRATVAGRSTALGDEADSEVFKALRWRVDAVLVGPETLRAEHYGALVRSPEARAQRRQAGLAERPLVVVLSRTLVLPLDIPLFTDPDSSIVVFSSSDRELPATAASVEVVRVSVDADLATEAMRILRSERGVRWLLCEGGPTTLGSLLAAGLLDELALTLAPKLVSGDGPTIVTSPALPAPARCELRAIYEHDSELLLRYRLLKGAPRT
jgi:riboflavin-specific deaminase-like protein